MGIGNGTKMLEENYHYRRPENPKRRDPYNMDNVRDSSKPPKIPKGLAWKYLKTK